MEMKSTNRKPHALATKAEIAEDHKTGKQDVNVKVRIGHGGYTREITYVKNSLRWVSVVVGAKPDT